MRDKSLRIMLIGLVVTAPLLVTCLFLWFSFSATLVDFVPSWSDEIHYWHETFTFSTVGFHGGYYVVDELPAEASFSRFGPHGPMFPMLCGFFGWVFGWKLYSGVFLNVVIVTCALGVFVYACRPDNKQLLMMLLVVSTFHPLVLYLPTNMQESLHQAFGIVLAGLFYRSFQRSPHAARLSWFLFALIVMASLFRTTWSVLFLPYFFLRMKKFSWIGLTKSVLFSGIFMALLFLLWQYLGAPYPYNFLSHFMRQFNVGSWDWVSFGIQHVKNNLLALTVFPEKPGITLHQLLRYQTLCLIGISFCRYFSVKRMKSLAIRFQDYIFPWLHISNLGIVLFLLIVCYDVKDYRDYRVLASHLLLSSLVFTICSQWKSVAVVVVMNCALVMPFIATYHDLHKAHFTYNQEQIALLRKQFVEVLQYEEHDDPWCNTVAFDVSLYKNREIIGFPEGLGLTAIVNWEKIRIPLASKYVLLKSEKFEQIQQKHDNAVLNFKPLMKTAFGVLYVNLNSQCRM